MPVLRSLLLSRPVRLTLQQVILSRCLSTSEARVKGMLLLLAHNMIICHVSD